jgi:hypothetical protein
VNLSFCFSTTLFTPELKILFEERGTDEVDTEDADVGDENDDEDVCNVIDFSKGLLIV